jgi:hypothetical protein
MWCDEVCRDRRVTVPGTIPPSPRQRTGLRPFDYPQAQASHEAVRALSVSQETAAHFGAGFAPRGVVRVGGIVDGNGELSAHGFNKLPEKCIFERCC